MLLSLFTIMPVSMILPTILVSIDVSPFVCSNYVSQHFLTSAISLKTHSIASSVNTASSPVCQDIDVNLIRLQIISHVDDETSFVREMLHAI